MSREFATSEVIVQKCSICGSKNKLYTQMTYKGIHYGYMLTCCNCGHVDTFIDSPNGPSGLLDSLFHKGKEICIQLTTCTKTDCKYYGKSTLWDSKTTLDEAFNKQNSGTVKEELLSSNNECVAFKNSNSIKLDTNGCDSDNPRFH